MQYELLVDGHGVTDIGKVRSKNEDSLLILDQQLIYCVADGMGGVSGGDIASQKVIECIYEQIGCLNTTVSLNDMMLNIHESVVQANEWILGWAKKNEAQGAGTTLVVLVLSREYPWAVNILHSGDSRAYRFREGQLQQITLDHSIEEAVSDFSEQPLPSQFRGLITNAVGLQKSLDLELTHAEQMAGDIWLLCSDGLNKMLSDEAIASILSSEEDASADLLAQRLVDEANETGGKDNVSVIIIKVLECSNKPAGALSVPFPGPLPCSETEDDETSQETSATDTLGMEADTSGSIIMSLETPNSETDLLDHGKNKGMNPAIRWILIALAGLIVISVLSKLSSGNKGSHNTEGRATMVESETTQTIEEIVSSAEQSGDWQTAFNLTQHGNFSNSDEYKTIDSWHREWAAAHNDPDGARKTLPEIIAAANTVLSAIKRDALPLSGSWPTKSDLIANEYCRRRYNMQQILAKELAEFWALNSHRISLMKMLPTEQIDAAFKVAVSDERKKKDFDKLLLDAQYAVQNLERWLKERPSLPINEDQLKAMPDSYIQYCNKTNILVQQLKVVLSESLDSGKLSNNEQRSIQQHLKGLIRFEEMEESARRSIVR